MKVVLFFIVSLILFFSSLLHFVENKNRVDNINEKWASIAHTLWFSFVSITTVGYGDQSPQTHLGQCISVVMIIQGIIATSMIIAIIGDSFVQAYSEYVRERDELLERDLDDKEDIKMGKEEKNTEKIKDKLGSV